MALTTVPASMRAFGPTTLVVRAANAVLTTLEAPVAPAWLTVGDAAAALGAPVALADTLAADSASADLLRVGAAIDGADRALARQVRAEDALAFQAEDAVLKLLMLGWARGATGGTLLDLQFGRVALLVWAAVDVALLGRYYERIADHAVIMASRIIYVVTGLAPEGENWSLA